MDFVSQTLLLLYTRQSFSAASKDLFLVSVLSKHLAGFISGELDTSATPEAAAAAANGGEIDKDVKENDNERVKKDRKGKGKSDQLKSEDDSSDQPPPLASLKGGVAAGAAARKGSSDPGVVDGTAVFRILHRLLQGFGADRADALQVAQLLVEVQVLRPVTEPSVSEHGEFDEERKYVVNPTAADLPETQGVLTKFARCYSRTCNINSTCYSPTCRRTAATSAVSESLLHPIESLDFIHVFFPTFNLFLPCSH